MHRMNHEDEEVELPALPPLTPVLGACGRYLQEVTLERVVAVAPSVHLEAPRTEQRTYNLCSLRLCLLICVWFFSSLVHHLTFY